MSLVRRRRPSPARRGGGRRSPCVLLWPLLRPRGSHCGAFAEFGWEEFLLALHKYARCEQRFGT